MQIKVRKTEWGELIFESQQIVCAQCGKISYVSGIAIRYAVEHGKPIPEVCPDCKVRQFNIDHQKKY
jgi:hypothetical protein